MWDTVTHVTSGITLVAFLIAAVVTILWGRLKHHERALALALPEDRAKLMESLSDSFLVSASPLDATGLSPEHTYNLLREQIRERTARFKITNTVFVILTLIAAGVTILLGRATIATPIHQNGVLTVPTRPTKTHILDPSGVVFGANLTIAAFPWLRDNGINLSDIHPDNAEVVIENNRALYKGLAVHPTTSENFLAEQGNTALGTFTLYLPLRVHQVNVTRPALIAQSGSGVTHPAWSIHALDPEGRDIASAEEPLTRSMTDVPQRTLTINAPPGMLIAAVRIDSDPRLNGKNFAAFNGVLIEQLTYVE